MSRVLGKLILFPTMKKPMRNWQGFYSTTQVSRLAGIPKRTLYAWKTKGIIAPSVQIIGAAGVKEEGYSYADLAIIKLMRGLRDRQLNLRSVAVALRHLFDRFGPPSGPQWQNAHVYLTGKVVDAQKPDNWGVTVATMGGQKRMEVIVGELFEEEAALLVPRSFADYVEIDPNVMEGMPVVRNTRIPTSVLAMMDDQGASLDELEDLYAPTPRDFLRMGVEFERTLDKATATLSA